MAKKIDWGRFWPTGDNRCIQRPSPSAFVIYRLMGYLLVVSRVLVVRPSCVPHLDTGLRS